MIPARTVVVTMVGVQRCRFVGEGTIRTITGSLSRSHHDGGRGGGCKVRSLCHSNHTYDSHRRMMWSNRMVINSTISNTSTNMNQLMQLQPNEMEHRRRRNYCSTSIVSSSSSSPSTGGFWVTEAIADLFDQYAQERQEKDKNTGEMVTVKTLDINDLENLLVGIGKKPANRYTLEQLFEVTDLDGNGTIDSTEFIENSAVFLSDTPARILLVIGGPGSGKGLLSKRLQQECNVVHLSSGDLLREEVKQQTSIGKTVQDIMSRGELVSSALIVALMKKRMRDHPGKRVLLDGFPRSPQNAMDLVTLCGKPELALHLVCDDTILMERIMTRGMQSSSRNSETSSENSSTATTTNNSNEVRREDDNFYAALHRLRTFHTFHTTTLEWLKEQHVPIINLDCSGNHESVWQQLVAIGRLMRPAVKLNQLIPKPEHSDTEEDWSNDPNRSFGDNEVLK